MPLCISITERNKSGLSNKLIVLIDTFLYYSRDH